MAVTTTGVSPSSSGIALQNVDRITADLTSFTQRASEVLKIVSTLSQFRRLGASAIGLPHISHEGGEQDGLDHGDSQEGEEEEEEAEVKEGGNERKKKNAETVVGPPESKQVPYLQV